MASYKRETIKCFIRPRSLGVDSDKITLNPDSPLKLTAKDKQFIFDGIFPEETSQSAVYEKVVKPYLDDFFNGYTYTIISYGPNGSGKSYTMFGCNKTSASPPHGLDFVGGLVPFAATDIFTRIEAMRYIEYTLKISLVEVHNEEIHDLLNGAQYLLTDSRHPQNHRETVVTSSSEFNKIITKTLKHRHAEQKCDTFPSHILLTVSLYSKSSNNQLHPVGKLQFVDLMGLSKDGRNVNKSLSTLNRCLQALIDKKQHIPYRESKLTHLLQDSLGGNTRTSFVVSIFSDFNDDMTLRVLNFAQKIREIVNVPERLGDGQKKSLQFLQEQIKRYQSDIDAASLANGVYVEASQHAQLVNNLEVSKTAYLENITGIKDLQVEVKQLKESIGESDAKLQSLEQEYGKLCGELRERRELYGEEQRRVAEKQYLANRYEEQEKMLCDIRSVLKDSTKNLEEEKEVLVEKMEKQMRINGSYNKCTKNVFKSILTSCGSFNEGVNVSKDKITKECEDMKENVREAMKVVRKVEKDAELEVFESTVSHLNGGLGEFSVSINESNEEVVKSWKTFLNSISSGSFVQEMQDECEKIENNARISFEQIREHWKTESANQEVFKEKINALVNEIVSVNVEERMRCEEMQKNVKDTRKEKLEAIKLLKDVKTTLNQATIKYARDQQSHLNDFLAYFKDVIEIMVKNFMKKIQEKYIQFKEEGNNSNELETNLLRTLLSEINLFYEKLTNDVYIRLETERLLMAESNAHVHEKVMKTLENLKSLNSSQEFTKHLIEGTETRTRKYVKYCEEELLKGKDIVQPLNKTGSTPVYNGKNKLLSKVQQGTPRAVLRTRFHEKINLGELSVSYNESSMLLDNSTSLVEDLDEN